MTARAKKLFSYLLKLCILGLTFWFVYHRILKNSDNYAYFKGYVAHLSHTKVAITLASIIMLMIINWLLEAFKWLHLTRVIAPMSLWQAIESVFCGLTWAAFTPNRIGEYGGRMMFLPVRRRIHGVFAMGVGAFGQNVITNVLGASASVWFLYAFIPLNRWIMLGIVVVAIGFNAIMLVFYFHIKWLVWVLNRIKFLKKFHRFFDIMAKYTIVELMHIMWFCLARFLVFTFQYYLIIHLLIPEIPLWQMAMLMFVFFFIQSAIPSLDVIDITVRGVTASTLFAYVTNQTVAVIAAVSLIYIINLIIPAILGSVFVLKLKFFDRTA